MKKINALVIAVTLAGCGGGGASPQPPTPLNLTRSAIERHHPAGLGVVLTSNAGQIYGYGIDQNGSDGVLATATNVETFDEDTGKITKSFPKTPPPGTTYSADGIVTGDVGLITRYVVPQGSIYAKRHYNVMNPVTAKKFTGKWTPPVPDIQVEAAGPNQTSSTTAIFAIELKHQDKPIVFSSDVPKNSFGKVFHLDPNSFSLGDGPQFAQDTSTNQGVFATSPDGGRVGGSAPINVLVDLNTGKETQWNGLNNGPFGSGFVNGLAVDSATGIAATTTELNAQVEFYNLANQTATFAQLPCTSNSSQFNSGSGVASDPVNKLFLVTEPAACQGSSIVVYDESGNFVEAITGFSFSTAGAPGAVIDPSKRMGWAVGPGVNQLQQFFY